MPTTRDLWSGGPLGGGRSGTSTRGPGIKVKIGGANVDVLTAFDHMAFQVQALQKQLGNLTEPFMEISNYLIRYLKDRMDSDYFNDSSRSSVTEQVRKARGQDPDGPYLVGSGGMRESIKRIKSSTESKKGGNYIKNILSIGSVGKPYAWMHIDGGTWNVPGFRGPERKDGKAGWFYPDMDSIAGTKVSNSAFYASSKPKWETIQKYQRDTYNMQIPRRNFLELDQQMDQGIRGILQKHFDEVFKDIVPPGI
jgi:hypothetical protein